MSKKKRGKQTKQNQQSQRTDDYDLKRSLSKLNQRRDLEESSTNSEYESNNSRKNINSSSSIASNNENTGFVLQINDSINSRYDKLKDDISCVSDKIGQSNSDLREEIDKKLDKKVSEKLFYGAISVVVVLGVLIYSLSYSDLIKDNKQFKTDISSIKSNANNVKKEQNSQKKSINFVESEIKKEKRLRMP